MAPARLGAERDLLAVRVGFGLVPDADSTQVIENTICTMLAFFRFADFIAQKAAHALPPELPADDPDQASDKKDEKGNSKEVVLDFLEYVFGRYRHKSPSRLKEDFLLFKKPVWLPMPQPEGFETRLYDHN
jgi:hypothetical protein